MAWESIDVLFLKLIVVVVYCISGEKTGDYLAYTQV